MDRLISLDHFEPTLGAWVVAVTPGLAEEIDKAAVDVLAEEISRVEAAGLTVWLRIPSGADEKMMLRICRLAHEVWVLEDELSSDSSRIARLAHQLRTESAPPAMGEHRSILRAPEMGLIRRWQRCQQGFDFIEEGGQYGEVLCREEMRRELHRLVKLLPQHDRENLANIADTLVTEAQGLKRRVRWTLLIFFSLTLLGIVALQAFAMSGWNVPMADFYAVFFMLVGSLYLRGRQHPWNARQEGLQALAEALRVHLLWRSAGLTNEIISSQLRLRHLDQYEWIRSALRPLNWEHAKDPQFSGLHAKAVLENWLSQEIRRHAGLAFSEQTKSLSFTRGVYFCYGLSAILTVLAMLPLVSEVSGTIASNAISIGLGLSSALGSLLLIFNGVMGYGPLAAVHRHMLGLLGHAQLALDKGLGDHEYEELLIDLGRESIQTAAERGVV